MAQLVELQKSADQFESLNTKVLFVFREETKGVDGLKKIKEAHDPSYLLAVDLDKKNSGGYSPKRMTFANYVIDSDGIVRAIVDGSLRDRAKAKELLRVLGEIESGKSNDSKD